MDIGGFTLSGFAEKIRPPTRLLFYGIHLFSLQVILEMSF